MSLKRIVATLLITSIFSLNAAYAENWVTITAENGKSADLDIDSIKMTVDTVEYVIKTGDDKNYFTNTFSTELYKEGLPTAIVFRSEYKNGVMESSEMISQRSYKPLKQGTLQAEIFDVLSKELEAKDFIKGQNTWDKYLKKQRKFIANQWKPKKFKNYSSTYIDAYKKYNPVYSNYVTFNINKNGTITDRKSNDYSTQLYEVLKLDNLPVDYTGETYKLNVDMKCFKYTGAKEVNNKQPHITKISPVESTITFAKNGKPPVIGNVEYGLLRAYKKSLNLSDPINKINDMNPLLGLLYLPVGIAGSLVTDVVAPLTGGILFGGMFLLAGGDFDDLGNNTYSYDADINSIMQTTPTPKLETSSNATTTSSASNSGTYSPKPSSASYSSNGGNYYPITPCDINIDNIGGGSSSMDSSLAQYFSPYIKDLQHRIKLNWNPPKDCNANKVVCLIKIGRDGRLLSSRVYKSSGYKSADMAALRAIEITAPFRQFPANFKEQSIDIQFTFDYIVRR